MTIPPLIPKPFIEIHYMYVRGAQANNTLIMTVPLLIHPAGINRAPRTRTPDRNVLSTSTLSG